MRLMLAIFLLFFKYLADHKIEKALANAVR